MSPMQCLRVHAQHLRTLARCHVSPSELSEDAQRRMHYLVNVAYENAAAVLDDAASKLEYEARS